jgi:cytochrome c-type biogenesis protein CcmH/NrfG
MLQDTLEEEPYNSEAWNLLAETYVALEKYPEAQEAADYSLAINPQDSNALLMKANAYMRDEQMATAIQHYTQYLEKQPDDPVSNQISFYIKPVRRDGQWYLTLADSQTDSTHGSEIKN